MPIKVIHDVPGIVPSQDEGMSKYGGPMVMQQQKYDQEARLQQGAQDNAMQRLMANPKYMEQMNQRAMIDTIRQDVANGMYEAADANQINGLLGTMSAANSGYLDESQRNQATSAAVARLAGITSNARQPVQNTAMQPPKMPPAPRNPQEAWVSNPKVAKEYMDSVMKEKMDAGETITREDAWKIARNNFDIDYKMQTGYVDPQPLGIALAPGHPEYKPAPTPTNQRDELGYVIMSDGGRVDPRDSAAMSSGGRQEQAVLRLTHPNGTLKEQKPAEMRELAAVGSVAGTASPVAQGQMPPQQSAPRFSHTPIQPGFRFPGQGPENPKGVKMTLSSMPPQYVLNDGTHVDSKWENGRWVPDLGQAGRSENPMMQGQPPAGVLGGGLPQMGGMAAPAANAPQQQKRDPSRKKDGTKWAPGERGYISFKPKGRSVTESGAAPMYNQSGQFMGDPSLYNAQGASNIQQQANPQSGQPMSMNREWTSSDGVRKFQGDFIGMRPGIGNEPSAIIRRSSDGQVFQVPFSKLSQNDQGFASSAQGNTDTMYDLANSGRSSGTNYFDPQNPAYAAMRAPMQQQPPSQGRFMGAYGMGGADYGMNQSTGNRVTGSVRPGGTMVQYDEPTVVRPPINVSGSAPAARNVMGVNVSPGGTPVVAGNTAKPSQVVANALPNAPSTGGYQYQSPLAKAASQAIASGSRPTAPTSKYGNSFFASDADREVEAAMRAGDDLEARDQAIRQQQAFKSMTSPPSPPPAPVSDEDRKKLGLPTAKEMESLKKGVEQNKAMGGISLGGTGRAAGSYNPPTVTQKAAPKDASKAGVQKKALTAQTGMSQAVADFASKQSSNVQDAIRDAYDTKLSNKSRENAIRFLLSKGIDLEGMMPTP